ncbi:hypothetical protein ACLM5J_12080 [Nocardioides sp. Bht2]|uniref:hypothetical protein n=1 Tax=Nocardioides sp. Bht2 TaxID=3392297 RepID=UPI0039B67145
MRLRRGWVTLGVAALLALGGLSPALAEPTGETSTTAETPRGSWRVDATPGGYLVSWTSPTDLPMGADRPSIVDAAGLPLGPTSVDATGRVVSVEVTGSAPEGATLDVVLSGDRLDVEGDDRARTDLFAVDTLPRLVAGRSPLASDPSKKGPYAVRTSNYTRPGVKMPGMPQPIEMVGHVVEPVADAVTGPRPLVVFLHGRHSVCYGKGQGPQTGDGWPCKPQKEIPSHLGYDYVQQVLASQGYATVSIRANGINAQDYRLADGGAEARASLIDAHLDYFKTLAAARQIDLDKVILIGHSRGGEGVNRASLRTPLDAGYTIAGQVLVAPTDFASQSAPYVPTVSLLPHCDGDVSDLQGQRFVDFNRDVMADDTSLKSAVMVFGANHNYFNTEWTPRIAAAPSWDDWGGNPTAFCGRKHEGRLSAAEQRRAGTVLMAGAVHLFAKDDQQMLPLFDGTGATLTSLGDAKLMSAAIGGGRDARRPGVDATLTASPTATSRLCRTVVSGRPSTACEVMGDSTSPHWTQAEERVAVRKAWEVSWKAVGQSAGLTFPTPLDVTGRRLELRTVVDAKTGSTRVGVRLTDADGASATLTPTSGEKLVPLPGSRYLVRNWAQSVIVDPSSAAIDLSRIKSVELVAKSAKGKVWVLDMAAADTNLPAAPAKRAPIIDVGKVTVDEGDAPKQGTAQVPLKVHGTLTAPATVRAVLDGEGSWGGRPVTITIPAGATSGMVDVSYERNTTHELYPRRHQVALAALSGAMTNNYIGGLTIRDDDPAPKVTIKVLTKKVREGQPIKIAVIGDARVGDWWPVKYRFVKGRGPVLRVADVGKWWEQRFGKTPGTKPLYVNSYPLGADLSAERRRVVVKVPTVRDGKKEGTEYVTLRFRDKQMTKKVTVRVVD